MTSRQFLRNMYYRQFHCNFKLSLTAKSMSILISASEAQRQAELREHNAALADHKQLQWQITSVRATRVALEESKHEWEARLATRRAEVGALLDTVNHLDELLRLYALKTSALQQSNQRARQAASVQNSPVKGPPRADGPPPLSPDHRRQFRAIAHQQVPTSSTGILPLAAQ